MASYKFVLFSGSKRIDGSYPISIRITKERKSKFIRTGLDTTTEEWDEKQERYVCNKKLVPEYKLLNAKLAELEVRINSVVRDFEYSRIDWTLNQFEDAFLNHTKKEKIYDYFINHIQILKDTNHTGNALCYSGTLHILELFDKKFKSKLFSEIDINLSSG